MSDVFGDLGAGTANDAWAFGSNVPVIVSVGAGNPTITNTAFQTVNVVLNEPIVPSSFTPAALTLTLNGGPNLINSGVTITETAPTIYEIAGLQPLTAGSRQLLSYGARRLTGR